MRANTRAKVFRLSFSRTCRSLLTSSMVFVAGGCLGRSEGGVDGQLKTTRSAQTDGLTLGLSWRSERERQQVTPGPRGSSEGSASQPSVTPEP